MLAKLPRRATATDSLWKVERSESATGGLELFGGKMVDFMYFYFRRPGIIGH
jgi:hypothetical protein